MKAALLTFGLVLSANLLACSEEAPPTSANPAATEPAKRSAGASKASFKLLANPSASDVPSGAIRGVANGQPFDVKAVIIEPGHRSAKEPGKRRWKIRLYQKALTKPTGHISKSQFIHVNLDQQPSKGKIMRRAMKYGGGFFQIQKPGDAAGKTTSWNSKNAYYIEFSEWDVKPYDESGKMFQVAGKASGKIYVGYEPSKGSKFRASGAAGEFKDAVVRYMGKPYWLRKK